MSDKHDDFLRSVARDLVTDMLRDPLLCIDYRNAVSDALDASSPEDRLTKWLGEIEYPTRTDFIRDALVSAPQTNLAWWDGGYLLQVDGRTLVTLEIGARVRVAGRYVAGASFADGGSCASARRRRRRGAASSASPASGHGAPRREATRRLPEAVAPASCGRATPRVRRPTTRSARPGAWRSARSASPPSSRPRPAIRRLPPTTTRASSRAGGGKLRRHDHPEENSAGVEESDHGPNYGVSFKHEDGRDDGDDRALLTYVEPATVDLKTTATRPFRDQICYSDTHNRTFDLTFGEFTEGVKSFSGTISIAPDDPAVDRVVSVVSGVCTMPLPEFTVSVINLLATAVRDPRPDGPGGRRGLLVSPVQRGPGPRGGEEEGGGGRGERGTPTPRAARSWRSWGRRRGKRRKTSRRSRTSTTRSPAPASRGRWPSA